MYPRVVKELIEKLSGLIMLILVLEHCGTSRDWRKAKDGPLFKEKANSGNHWLFRLTLIPGK